MENVVEIKQVYKRFGEITAVDGVSLEIFRGECFGLLGPNGAGKSTLMKMMYGSSLITEGELYVLGLNIKKSAKEVKRRIGVVPQDDSLDTDFSVAENLQVYSDFHGLSLHSTQERTQTLLRLLKLEDCSHRNIDELSGGMKRRLAIARGLINNPDVLFLDEPTTGLDPQARTWLWEFFHQMKALNATLVMTTHYMEEAEQVCDRIAIMDKGKILSIGRPKDLIEEHIGKEVVEFSTNPVDLNYYLGRLKENSYSYQVSKNTVSVLVKTQQEGRKVFDLVSSDKITIRKPTLNDVFLKLAGYFLRDQE